MSNTPLCCFETPLSMDVLDSYTIIKGARPRHVFFRTDVVSVARVIALCRTCFIFVSTVSIIIPCKEALTPSGNNLRNFYWGKHESLRIGTKLHFICKMIRTVIPMQKKIWNLMHESVLYAQSMRLYGIIFRSPEYFNREFMFEIFHRNVQFLTLSENSFY